MHGVTHGVAHGVVRGAVPTADSASPFAFRRRPDAPPPRGPAHPGGAAGHAQRAAEGGAGPRPLLQVDGVSLSYRTPSRLVRATHQVSFDVHDGERYVLLGPSGCGKSTLLKAIGGFIAPSEGEIRLDGHRVQAPGPDRIVVFQEFDQLPPWKTVLGNVMFPLRVAARLGRREARDRAMAMLDTVGLARFADAHPHELSGGMKQRVAIARALAMRPRVLLMDEPFAALDALTRRRMQDELLQLWAQVRFTLVFVTHSIEEALLVGHRVALLSPHPGRMRAEIDAQAYGPDGMGSEAFQATTQRVQGLLFEPQIEPQAPPGEAP